MRFISVTNTILVALWWQQVPASWAGEQGEEIHKEQQITDGKASQNLRKAAVNYSEEDDHTQNVATTRAEPYRVEYSPDIEMPHVLRMQTSEDIIVDEAHLPLGIKLTGGEKLREHGLTGKGVRVAIIDSGIDAWHQGFSGRVTKQTWFRSGTPLAEDDHGTHVAGTIHMMAPDAELFDYRVFGENGFPIADAIAISIYEAVFDGCDVINMSIGGRWPTSKIRTAVEYANEKGVIVVCAAGNEGDGNPLTNERSYPALWDEAISIAAVSKEHGLPVINFSNTNPQIDYAGIGVDAVSFKPGGGLQTMSGTSMASPHAAGLVAALLSKTGDIPIISTKNKKEWKNALVKVLNENYVIDIGEMGKDVKTGHGFLTYLNKEEFNSIWMNPVVS